MSRRSSSLASAQSATQEYDLMSYVAHQVQRNDQTSQRFRNLREAIPARRRRSGGAFQSASG
jgi:hypothetical protein